MTLERHGPRSGAVPFWYPPISGGIHHGLALRHDRHAGLPQHDDTFDQQHPCSVGAISIPTHGVGADPYL